MRCEAITLNINKKYVQLKTNLLYLKNGYCETDSGRGARKGIPSN